MLQTSQSGCDRRVSTPVGMRQLAFTDTMPIPFALGGITVLLDATLLAAPSRRHGFQP